MAELEENKHGVFKQDLMRTFRQLKESRAESVSEDVEIIYKREIEDLCHKIRNFDRDRENLLLDLSPMSAGNGAVVPSDFDPAAFMRKDVEVYLVTRSYLTRHGNGYEPKYKLEANLEKFKESNTFNEFQLDFKVGCLETGLLRRAAERHRLDNYKLMYNLKYNLVVTHTDVIVDSGRFDYMGEDLFDYVVKPTHETIATTVDEYTDLSYDRVFYNDSQESNLKQVR